ncbi:MAG: hypothetical protein APG12_01567 [Candidatus Methanofastidiosum methylothiophilum]|uniref:Uncharacterized protein n=1 Tax=Candidatus Methanofastidiosum methylothiophilum TaxID=1705564 RepID=A0A150IWD7_9EURY|nr:MAG: hypothetical protein APG10_01564 [Candidatus Methanofastidiosum methylthiophilus]KYC46890.1 MAG: hypothetical protein APG11_01609 [Candidatus Methanofastidiosum methylthiophilus]KYC49319.1 MAG: hypothetical protein APG12_01567 [Candidatus Methanofastidiosum methylthiophilus]
MFFAEYSGKYTTGAHAIPTVAESVSNYSQSTTIFKIGNE